MLDHEALEAFEAALDRSPAPVSFWWRDDDAGRPSPRLERLVELSRGTGTPLLLATVPGWLSDDVAALIERQETIHVAQHGWLHADHSRPGEKRIELGGTASLERLRDQLSEGRCRLLRAFAGKMLPVLVPPWNRIHTSLVSELPALGYAGISTFGADRVGRSHDLVHVNPLIDPIAWRTDRSFATLSGLVDRLIPLIASARSGSIGLLTHHLDMDEAAFEVIESLFSVARRHSRARWPSPEELFARIR